MCLEMNFIKICPEIALKYLFEKMWFYMKYIVKNRGWQILIYPAISTFAVQICYTNKFLVYSY